MPPTIPVSDPGTSSTEFVASEAEPSIKFFVKRWTPSSSPPKAAVVFVHGFLENIERYDHVFPVFASKGIEVTAFDQRGFGETAKQGSGSCRKEHGNTTRQLQYKDLEQMIRTQKKRTEETYGAGKVPLFLMGHSMGGGLTLATFTRPASEPFFPKETLDGIKGAVALAPWLRLTNNPNPIVPFAAGILCSALPSLKKRAPLDAKATSRDPMVQEEYIKNPFTNPDVYLKAIHGPLTSGLNILNKEYANFPQKLPLLIVHGTADSICDYKGSKQFIERVKADDKQLITMEGYYHEMHNEPGDDKVVLINHVTDWILAHAGTSSSEQPSTATATPAAEAEATSQPVAAAADEEATPAGEAPAGDAGGQSKL